MIVYIEDKNNNRVGYIITTGKTFDQYDILTGIDINHYSKVLINLPASKRVNFIKRIDKLINYKMQICKFQVFLLKKNIIFRQRKKNSYDVLLDII